MAAKIVLKHQKTPIYVTDDYEVLLRRIQYGTCLHASQQQVGGHPQRILLAKSSIARIEKPEEGS